MFSLFLFSSLLIEFSKYDAVFIIYLFCVLGHTFGLPDSVAGITILAAGISVPEIIASVIVVKNGMRFAFILQ